MQNSTPSAADPLLQAPRIGVPFRRASEERAKDRKKIAPYLKAIEAAGGQPRLISLFLSPEQLLQVCAGLDGLLLPGSPADVDPSEYGQSPRPETAEADSSRDQTDKALLDWAFAESKPVLAICFGTQLLNVYRRGTLVQDIRGQLPSALKHDWEPEGGLPEPYHPIHLLPGSRLARLAETAETVVNSSHHQSVERPGKGLRVTAKSPDGVVEAVELEGATHWVVGVQWHPERQQAGADSGARLAAALFRDLVRISGESCGESRSAGVGSNIIQDSEGK